MGSSLNHQQYNTLFVDNEYQETLSSDENDSGSEQDDGLGQIRYEVSVLNLKPPFCAFSGSNDVQCCHIFFRCPCTKTCSLSHPLWGVWEWGWRQSESVVVIYPNMPLKSWSVGCTSIATTLTPAMRRSLLWVRKLVWLFYKWVNHAHCHYIAWGKQCVGV